MSDELLINVVEAGRRLGLGRSFTYGLIRTGDLPSLKIGGARRVAVVDLERLVERLRAAGENDGR